MPVPPRVDAEQYSTWGSRNPAFDITIAEASVSDYTLTVMTWVAGFGLPVVLGYQAWTYWVFRKRISVDSIPEPARVGHGGHLTNRRSLVSQRPSSRTSSRRSR